MRKILIMLVILTCVSLFLGEKYKHKMKYIGLPEILHNTIGNIPIVEALDDGEAYFQQRTPYCDEIMYTCMLKFGYSRAVSRRILTKKLLDTCEEAKEVQTNNLLDCFVDCYDWYTEKVPEYIPKCERICKEQHQYLPECDDEPPKGEPSWF